MTAKIYKLTYRLFMSGQKELGWSSTLRSLNVSGSDNPDQSYLSPDGTPIENKQHLRDLGVQLSSDCTFSIHIDNVVTSVSKMLGWVLRTFRSRSKVVMMTCWSSLLQSRLDYCCQLWSPCDHNKAGGGGQAVLLPHHGYGGARLLGETKGITDVQLGKENRKIPSHGSG